MTTTLKYTCGHESRINPASLGRGEPRKQRLTPFSRECPKCRLANQAAKLTLVDGTPYTAEQQAAYVARRLPKLY
jgi:hypothetical protein